MNSAPMNSGARRRSPRWAEPRIILLAVLLVPALLQIACSSDKSGTAKASDASSTTVDASTQTVTTETPGPPPGATLEGFKDLAVGTCFEQVKASAAEDRAVWLLDCADPHSFEVYWITTYQGEGAGRGTSYPGTATVQNGAEQACFDQFETFVGVRWTLSELDIRAWWPTEESWARADRTVICTVFAESGEQLTGTRRGSAK
ncbi:MAG: septum formation family protein [Actinomycetes bacterium]